MIQPIVVRPHGKGYQIVAGERRWRAAQRRGCMRCRSSSASSTMPKRSRSRWSRISSAAGSQRDRRRPEAYHRLLEDYGHTQEALGKLVHKSRSHIANLLRLLDLPERRAGQGGGWQPEHGPCSRADRGARYRAACLSGHRQRPVGAGTPSAWPVRPSQPRRGSAAATMPAMRIWLHWSIISPICSALRCESRTVPRAAH